MVFSRAAHGEVRRGAAHRARGRGGRGHLRGRRVLRASRRSSRSYPARRPRLARRHGRRPRRPRRPLRGVEAQRSRRTAHERRAGHPVRRLLALGDQPDAPRHVERRRRLPLLEGPRRRARPSPRSPSARRAAAGIVGWFADPRRRPPAVRGQAPRASVLTWTIRVLGRRPRLAWASGPASSSCSGSAATAATPAAGRRLAMLRAVQTTTRRRARHRRRHRDAGAHRLPAPRRRARAAVPRVPARSAHLLHGASPSSPSSWCSWLVGHRGGDATRPRARSGRASGILLVVLFAIQWVYFAVLEAWRGRDAGQGGPGPARRDDDRAAHRLPRRRPAQRPARGRRAAAHVHRRPALHRRARLDGRRRAASSASGTSSRARSSSCPSAPTRAAPARPLAARAALRARAAARRRPPRRRRAPRHRDVPPPRARLGRARELELARDDRRAARRALRLPRRRTRRAPSPSSTTAPPTPGASTRRPRREGPGLMALVSALTERAFAGRRQRDWDQLDALVRAGAGARPARARRPSRSRSSRRSTATCAPTSRAPRPPATARRSSTTSRASPPRRTRVLYGHAQRALERRRRARRVAARRARGLPARRAAPQGARCSSRSSLFFVPFFGGLFATLADPGFALRIVPEAQLRPLVEAYKEGFSAGRGAGPRRG